MSDTITPSDTAAHPYLTMDDYDLHPDEVHGVEETFDSGGYDASFETFTCRIHPLYTNGDTALRSIDGWILKTDFCHLASSSKVFRDMLSIDKPSTTDPLGIPMSETAETIAYYLLMITKIQIPLSSKDLDRWHTDAWMDQSTYQQAVEMKMRMRVRMSDDVSRPRSSDAEVEDNGEELEIVVGSDYENESEPESESDSDSNQDFDAAMEGLSPYTWAPTQIIQDCLSPDMLNYPVGRASSLARPLYNLAIILRKYDCPSWYSLLRSHIIRCVREEPDGPGAFFDYALLLGWKDLAEICMMRLKGSWSLGYERGLRRFEPWYWMQEDLDRLSSKTYLAFVRACGGLKMDTDKDWEEATKKFLESDNGIYWTE